MPERGRFSHKGILCSPSRFLRNHELESGDSSYCDVRQLCSVPAYRELVQESMRKHFVGCFPTAKLRKTLAEHKPDFIAAYDGQQHEFVCSKESFIAYLAMSLPTMLRPSPWRKSPPFRDCGGYSRWSSDWVAAEELEPL